MAVTASRPKVVRRLMMARCAAFYYAMLQRSQKPFQSECRPTFTAENARDAEEDLRNQEITYPDRQKPETTKDTKEHKEEHCLTAQTAALYHSHISSRKKFQP